MNKIQKNILKKLSKLPTAKYSEIKPKSIEGNIFSYHLKKLIGLNLIERDDGLYSLSSSGKFFIQKTSIGNMKFRSQPSIVTLVICENKEKEYLLYKRSKQPNINQWGFPAGKIHENEPLSSSVKRELFEKTGLVSNPKHLGLMYLTFYDDNSNIFISIMVNIFFTKNASGKLKNGPDVAGLEWVARKDLKRFDLMPGAKEMLKETLKNTKKVLPKGKIFYKEMFVHI